MIWILLVIVLLLITGRICYILGIKKGIDRVTYYLWQEDVIDMNTVNTYCSKDFVKSCLKELNYESGK